MKKKPISPPIQRQDDVNKIQKAVAESFGYTREQLLAPGREEPRITARHMAIELCWKYTLISEREMMVAFQYKDVTPIRYILAHFMTKIRKDARAKKTFDKICQWAAKEFPKKELVA